MECSNSQLKKGKIFEIQHSLQVSFIARWLKPSTWNMKTNVSCRLRECPIIRLLLEVWGDLEAEKGTKKLCNNHNIILLYQVWKGGSEEKKEENTNGGNDDRTIQSQEGHFELHTKENRLVLEKYFPSNGCLYLALTFQNACLCFDFYVSGDRLHEISVKKFFVNIERAFPPQPAAVM